MREEIGRRRGLGSENNHSNIAADDDDHDNPSVDDDNDATDDEAHFHFWC